MALHSTHHNGHNGGPQHPDPKEVWINGDANKYPLVAGVEWNIVHDWQLDLTFWFSWYDNDAKGYVKKAITKTLWKGSGDFYQFYNTLNGWNKESHAPGYFVVLNIAQGGNGIWEFDPNKCLQDGDQFMHIHSVKVYGY